MLYKVFIIKEENEFKNLIIESESSDLPKENNITIFKTQFAFCSEEKDNNNNLKNQFKLLWFKYNSNSCRYDSFFLMHTLILNYLKNKRGLHYPKIQNVFFKEEDTISC